MFRMLGNKVELYRYKITYNEDEVEQIEYCISNEHKNAIESNLQERGIEFVTETVNQEDNEWIDGLEFESRDKAIEALKKGEQAYLLEQEQKQLIDNLQLRADIDFISIMSGVEI